MILCNKHKKHMKRHGKILKRTVYTSNEILVNKNYAEIIIYNKGNKEKIKTKIDKEDIEKVKKYKWCLSGTIENGYIINSLNKIYLHHYLINFNKETKNEVVDHINRDRLDNRKNNLRICTFQENSFNKSLNNNNKSGITGVYWNESRNKWVAKLEYNGEFKLFKRFNRKEKAIEARKKAEKKYFGEFAPIRKDD